MYQIVVWGKMLVCYGCFCVVWSNASLINVQNMLDKVVDGSAVRL